MPGKQKPLKKCPVCGSKDVSKIVRISGTASIYDPSYLCQSCGKEIGSPPYLKTDHGVVDYRDITTRIRIREEGLYPGYGEIRLRQMESGAELELLGDQNHPDVYLKKAVPEKKWRNLLDRIYRETYVHEWQKNFMAPNEKQESWQLELMMTNRRRRRYYGGQLHPPYWKEFVQLFKQFFV